jgi:hypothetical protein
VSATARGHAGILTNVSGRQTTALHDGRLPNWRRSWPAVRFRPRKPHGTSWLAAHDELELSATNEEVTLAGPPPTSGFAPVTARPARRADRAHDIFVTKDFSTAGSKMLRTIVCFDATVGLARHGIRESAGAGA